MTRAFFAARHADAEELDAFRRQVAGAHVRVFEVGVAGIDDEIARLEVREQIVDDRIHGRAGGHQHHHRARLAQQADELLDVRRAADVTFLRFLAQRLDLGGPCRSPPPEAVVGHVQHEIAPHDAQADHADFKRWLRLPTPHGIAPMRL